MKMRAIASKVIGTAARLFLSAVICLLAAGCEIYQVRDEVNVYIVLPEEPPKPELSVVRTFGTDVVVI